ncbi:spermine/spermidine synthase domain-containing protein [Hydrogenimonas sp.]
MWLTQEAGGIVKSEYDVKEKLFEKEGVELYDSGYFGKILLDDGRALYCEHDSAMRHEVMAHTAMCTHEDPARVLVIDGGDGALAAELLKHPEVRIDIVEPCGAMAEAAVAMGCCADALEDRRVSMTIGDPATFLSEKPDGEYDIVFLNRCGDGRSESGLLSQIERVLDPKGLVVSDASSQLLDMAGHKSALAALENFRIVMPFCYTSMVRPGGEWWLAMGSRFFHPTADINLQRADLTDGFTYYNSDLHIARFALPTSVFEQLRGYVKR